MASIIQTNHITCNQISIAINISKGLIPRALFITIGTISHSICCIIINNIKIDINQVIQKFKLATISAGIAQSIGHKYGINSINQAIRANVHLLSKDIQNKDKVKSQKYTVNHINNHNKICHFNHSQSWEYNFANFKAVYLGVCESVAIVYTTLSFSKEKNIDKTNTIIIWLIIVKKLDIIFIAKEDIFFTYSVKFWTILEIFATIKFSILFAMSVLSRIISNLFSIYQGKWKDCIKTKIHSFSSIFCDFSKYNTIILKISEKYSNINGINITNQKIKNKKNKI